MQKQQLDTTQEPHYKRYTIMQVNYTCISQATVMIPNQQLDGLH